MLTRWTLVLGMATVVGCGTPINSTGTLNTTGATDSGAAVSGGNACNDTCAAQARVGCSGFQMGSCVSTCQSQFALYPGCAAQLDVAVRCSAAATYTCSPTTNRPTTSSCIAELVTALRCVTPDAGL